MGRYSKGPGRAIPALLTRPNRCPEAMTSAAALRTASSLARSKASVWTRLPNSFRNLLRPSSVRAVAQTSKPSFSRAVTVVWPIPPIAPVTRTVRGSLCHARAVGTWRLAQWVAVTALPVGLLVSGCTPAGEAAARIAGDRFQTALRGDDLTGACQLFSEEARGNLESASGQPCSAALADWHLPTGTASSIEVWGDNAQVRLETGVLFLAKFRAGWKVTAAGCEPRPDMPYDGAVEG